jgi:hypothetical protein
MRHLQHRHFPADARHLSLLPPPARGATPEMHWRHRRNIVIYLIHRQGVPHQLTADAFDLGTVQVRNIIRIIKRHDKSLANNPLPRARAGAARRFVGEDGGGTPLERWRFRRNVIMRLAHRIGLSRELIGDLFDLHRSAVNAILKQTPRGRGRGRAGLRHDGRGPAE